MKISELIVLLEKNKEEYGDIRVGTYISDYDRVKEFTEVVRYWDEDNQPYVEIG